MVCMAHDECPIITSARKTLRRPDRPGSTLLNITQQIASSWSGVAVMSVSLTNVSITPAA